MKRKAPAAFETQRADIPISIIFFTALFALGLVDPIITVVLPNIGSTLYEQIAVLISATNYTKRFTAKQL